MILQKEEKIVVVLLVMAVLSLIIGYFGFSEETAPYSSYSPDSKVGERVYAEGAVLSKQMTKTGDNLILTVANLDAKVFIRKNNGAKEVYDSVKVGERVRITGKVDVFKDSREIVVESETDVVKL